MHGLVQSLRVSGVISHDSQIRGLIYKGDVGPVRGWLVSRKVSPHDVLIPSSMTLLDVCLS